jgi:hypothetical protein
MTASHSQYEQNPLQHAHDIAFATFRVAALVTHQKLRAEIEHAAVDLVVEYDTVITNRLVSGYGQKLQALIQLAESVGHMHGANASVLLREINSLQSAIVSIIDTLEAQSQSATLDLEEILNDRKNKTNAFLSGSIEQSVQSATPETPKIQSAIADKTGVIGNDRASAVDEFQSATQKNEQNLSKIDELKQSTDEEMGVDNFQDIQINKDISEITLQNEVFEKVTNEEAELQSAIEKVFDIKPIITPNEPIIESLVDEIVNSEPEVIVSEDQTVIFDAIEEVIAEEAVEIDAAKEILRSIPNRLEEKEPDFKPLFEGTKRIKTPVKKDLRAVRSEVIRQEEAEIKENAELKAALKPFIKKTAEKSTKESPSKPEKAVEEKETTTAEIYKEAEKTSQTFTNTFDDCDLESPDNRQGGILQFVRNLPNGCRMRDLALAFPEVSERTLRNDLQTLVSQHSIERFGSQGPFSYYRAVTKHEVLSL